MAVQNSPPCVIALSSVTYAIQASKLLKNEKIYSRVVQLDSSRTKKGCANGIELDCAQLSRAKRILYQRGIPISETVGGANG